MEHFLLEIGSGKSRLFARRKVPIFDESSYPRSFHSHRSSSAPPDRLRGRYGSGRCLPHILDQQDKHCGYVRQVGPKFGHHWLDNSSRTPHTCSSSIHRVWGGQIRSIMEIAPSTWKNSSVRVSTNNQPLALQFGGN